MKVALAQINCTVGDIEGNTALILANLARAGDAGADLVVFPELAVFGYPPKDLLLRNDLVDRNVRAMTRIAEACTGITAVVGYVEPDASGSGRGRFNTAAVCRDGTLAASYAKMLLPTYDVFDETRHFSPGAGVQVFSVTGDRSERRFGLTVCEDLWNDHQFEGRRVYGVDPIELTASAGAGVVINISASPYRAGVQAVRERLFAEQMREHGVSLVYVNQIGGQDDLLFDGASLILDAEGNVVARAKAFEEDLLVADLDQPAGNRVEVCPERIEGIRRALVLGIGDYLRRCGFSSAVIGLSGGIDSAVTAALAVEALGPDRVQGVAMPSRYSSGHSVEDARQLAANLGIEFSTVPIEDAHRATEEAVAPLFAKFDAKGDGVAEENIQARIRGSILMALSNKAGALLLTTGNKSEIAVGYCTLYGDMCGGLAVLSDVPKTAVYELARHMNATWSSPCIPERTIDKPPSAELRENQLDQDTLPAYDVLDPILEHYVEQEASVDEIVALGFDRPTVERVARLVDRSEFKRKQAAVGLKVTSRAFGTGRRMPIAAKYH
ncbi:MAG: NAD+ synthase [Phycisphaerae bacterium]|jgi:NAD+ synthetase